MPDIERSISMEINYEELKAKYSGLVKEFGEKGAAVITGVPEKFVEDALSGSSERITYAEKIAKCINARAAYDGFYTAEQCRLLLSLEHLIADSGSMGNAAKAMGVSNSTISDIRNCKYRGDVQKFFSDFESYLSLKNQQKAQGYKGTDYVPTSVSEYIYQVIRGVHIAGDCEIITGDTGVGKSRTVSKYAADHPENTIVVTPTYADSSVLGILKLIAYQLGISGTNRIYELNAAILNRLHDGMLIIIDEAQHLKFAAIDHLRSISDSFTDRGETMGICFVGNPSFMKHFDDKKIAVTGQVFNRANLRPYIRSSDIKIDDIKLLFPELAENHKNAEIKFLYAIAQTNGEGLRRAINFYKTAYNMDGGDVNIERLAELAQMGNLRIPNISSIIKRLKEEQA